MSQFNAGTHLMVFRGTYFHHGLSVGNDEVIHYGGDGFSDGPCRVCHVSLSQFADGHDVSVIKHPDRMFGRLKSVQRARARLGEEQYSLVFNNCEHFVNWCIEGERRSRQVQAVVAGTTAAVGYRYVVAKTGEQVSAQMMRNAIPALASVWSSLSGGKKAATVASASVSALAPASSMAVGKGVSSAVAGLGAGAGTSALVSGSATAAGLVGTGALATVAAPAVAVMSVGALILSLWDD